MAHAPQPPARAWLLTFLFVFLLAAATFGLLTLAVQSSIPTAAATLPCAVLWLLATALAWAAYLRPGLTPLAWQAALAATGFSTGLLAALPYEIAHTLTAPHIGLSNLYQVSIFTLAVTGILALGFDLSFAPGKLLPFATPILAAAALFSAWLAHIGAAVPNELIPALQNAILPAHVAANFIGYGCFAIAAAAGAALLLRTRADTRRQPTRLPPAAQLEKLAYTAIAIGFPVFSLAILLGCVWAYQAWGGYWSWDPKETWALIVWLTYAAYLHARPQHRLKNPRFLAWWLLVGFLLTLFCYIGVNMFLSGLHSYGTLGA